MKASFIICIVIFVACVSHKKEVKYILPDEMLPHVKVMYAQTCDRGYMLWQKNCSGCHNQKVRRKEIIPDFKPEQLVGYSLRLTNKRHEVTLTDTVVSEEDLAVIMTFLNFKKKNKIR